jgi:predicted NBD/HSP70 family sugar kinase
MKNPKKSHHNPCEAKNFSQSNNIPDKLYYMILAIDIGGTKTLVALADEKRKVHTSEKFKTPENYKNFLKELGKVVDKFASKYSTTVVAAPGRIDRKSGSGISFGNLPWKNVPLKKDLEQITKSTVLVENDANLAGLGEAHNLKPTPHKVLYLTVSTGIGDGIITDGVIDPDFADSEAGKMMFEHQGKLLEWEKFASGKSIVNEYGKMASEINDPVIWNNISQNLAVGIVDLCTVLNPNIVIIGGGVGTHFSKFEKQLNAHIKNIVSPMVDVPKIIPAQTPEQAVIYGCLELARQNNHIK